MPSIGGHKRIQDPYISTQPLVGLKVVAAILDSNWQHEHMLSRTHALTHTHTVTQKLPGFVSQRAHKGR